MRERYGASIATFGDVDLSSNLDALAASGTVFTNAQLPASICRPTLQTLLSGLHPQQWEDKRKALATTTTLPLREELWTADLKGIEELLGQGLDLDEIYGVIADSLDDVVNRPG